METTVLALEGVHKSFAGVCALADVSLDVRAGEVHALVGENGAGKSTLIRILAGVFPPDAGRVLLDGSPISFRSPHDALVRGIAAIHQEPALCPSLSVLENVFLGCLPRRSLGRVDWARARERATEILSLLDIQVDLDAEAGRLSAAVQQTVEIARALARDARVLIMDEPTASLPHHEVGRLLRVVERLRERGVGILYISHRLEEVFSLADRVTVLRDGRHVATAPAGEFTREKLIALMVGRELAETPPRAVAPPGEVALRVRDLRRRGQDVGVSLELRAGEILGLAGLVGSGRTELAHSLFGLDPFESGSVEVFGKPARIHGPRDALACGLAYVPEDRRRYGLVLPMAISANVSLAALSAVSRAGFLRRSAERALAGKQVEALRIRMVGLGQPAAELSGGNQQKVSLAKWLVREPRILLLDEPTRGVDVGAKAEIHRLVAALAERGLAVLLISSDLPEVLALSDRVLVMRHGRIAGELPRAEATQERVMALALG